MKDKKLIKEIISQVVTALIIQIILFGIGYIFVYFNKEKVNITICSSTKVDLGYSTSINIKNFQNDKSIESITIWTTVNVNTNVLNYKDVEIYNEKIVIKNIPPSYDGTIIVHSTEKINEENTKFETQEKRNVNFLYMQDEEISFYWKEIILNLFVDIIIYAIMGVIVYIIINRQIELYKQRINQIKHSNENIENEYKKIKEELSSSERKTKELYITKLKIKIFLHRKLVDYAKELDFYKNLIKNIVNKIGNEEDICYHITKQLKTFKTLEKINAQDLEIDSLELSEIEKEKISKELLDD